jgi:hypothetical protein
VIPPEGPPEGTPESDVTRFERFLDESDRAIEREGIETDRPVQEDEVVPLQPTTTPPTDWIRPGDGLASSPKPVARIRTGIPTFNSATRGGPPTGSATLILGAPDAGKTGLAMTIADEAEKQGFVVIHLTPDGGREAAELRWAQMMGLDRQKLEERDPNELTRFRADFASRNVYLPDPDLIDGTKPVNTLTYVIDMAGKVHSGACVLLLIDSLQTVKPDHETHDGGRARVDAVLGHVRRAASISGWIVVATSQTNRASRRHKNEDENSDPMTAGMESGAIEHVFDLMLFLDGDAASTEGVRVRITKNKPGAGRKPIFRLKWDRDKARFSEMDAETLERETTEMVEREAAARRETLLAIVTNEPNLSTAGVLRAARAAEIECRNDTLVLDLQALKRDRLIYDKSIGNGYYWHPGPRPDDTSPHTSPHGEP